MKKMIEKPEVKVVKIDHVDVCTASANPAYSGGTWMTVKGKDDSSNWGY